LLMEGTDFFKRVARGDAVDKEETFSCAHVLFPHGAKNQCQVSRGPEIDYMGLKERWES
jgi:hypothetical protein